MNSTDARQAVFRDAALIMCSWQLTLSGRASIINLQRSTYRRWELLALSRNSLPNGLADETIGRAYQITEIDRRLARWFEDAAVRGLWIRSPEHLSEWPLEETPTQILTRGGWGGFELVLSYLPVMREPERRYE